MTPEQIEAPPLPEPGIYEGVRFDEYLSWPYVHNSAFGSMLKSPADYRYHCDEEHADSTALRLGRLLHTGELEPDKLLELYEAEPATLYDGVRTANGKEPANPAATVEGKERLRHWLESCRDRGKEPVNQEWIDDLRLLLGGIRKNPLACDYLRHAGPAEVSIVWDDEETGLRCKARLDKWDRGRRLIADLKSTRDVHWFDWEVGKYSYHRQAAFYVDGADQATGTSGHQAALVAVDKSPPYSCRAACLSPQAITDGRAKYRRALNQIRECLDKGEWPGPPNPEYWEPPARYLDDAEILVWD